MEKHQLIKYIIKNKLTHTEYIYQLILDFIMGDKLYFLAKRRPIPSIKLMEMIHNKYRWKFTRFGVIEFSVTDNNVIECQRQELHHYNKREINKRNGKWGYALSVVWWKDVDMIPQRPQLRGIHPRLASIPHLHHLLPQDHS